MQAANLEPTQLSFIPAFNFVHHRHSVRKTRPSFGWHSPGRTCARIVSRHIPLRTWLFHSVVHLATPFQSFRRSRFSFLPIPPYSLEGICAPVLQLPVPGAGARTSSNFDLNSSRRGLCHQGVNPTTTTMGQTQSPTAEALFTHNLTGKRKHKSKTQNARSGKVTENTSGETRVTKLRSHSTTSLGAVLLRNREKSLLFSIS